MTHITTTDDALSAFRQLRGYTVQPPAPAAKSTGLETPALDAPNGELWQRTYDRVFSITGDPVKAYLAALGMVQRGRMRLATKARKDGLVTIEGWSNLFGDPNFKDLDNQFFDANTNFLLDWFAHSPLWYEHGEDPVYGVHPIGRRIGHQVFPEYGVYLAHELLSEHPQFQRTTSELANGELTYSTDSIYHFVERGYKPQTGQLSVWPLAGASLVRRPAEPGLGVVVISGEDEV